jgi:hypothetical protein
VSFLFFFANQVLRPHTSANHQNETVAGTLDQGPMHVDPMHVDPLAGLAPPFFNTIGGNSHLNPGLGLAAPAVPATPASSHARSGKSLACVCGKTFTRKHTLERHIRTAAAKELRMLPQGPLPNLALGPSSTGFECGYCTKYLGLNAFARRDNLRQHLRRSHRKTEDEIRDYFQRYDSFIAQSRFLA